MWAKIKKSFLLSWMVVAACLLGVGCSPSPRKACEAFLEKLGQCEGTKFGQADIDLCAGGIEKMTESDKNRAQEMSKALYRCAKMDQCNEAESCAEHQTISFMKELFR